MNITFGLLGSPGTSGASATLLNSALAGAEAKGAKVKRYDLIDAGRYWLNRDLKRCLVDDGKVVVID